MKRILAPLFAIIVLSLLAWSALSAQPAIPNPVDRLMTPQEILARFGGFMYVEQGYSHKNLTIFPVTLKVTENTTQYTSLDEALENKWIKISEVNSGSVPELRLEVFREVPMFFMAGEVVTGAKQDRILQSDLLFRGKAGAFIIPVYCVESGRWVHESESFSPGKTLGSKNVRQAAAMKKGQTTVWDEVASKNYEMAADTDTSKFQANYDSTKYKDLSPEYFDALRDIPLIRDGKAVGVVIAINGKITSADVFANADIFKSLWPKVLKASVMDAVSAEAGTMKDNTAAREFLGTGISGSIAKNSNPSMGEEYSIEAGKVQGHFMVTDGTVVHLALFSHDPSKRRPEPQEQIYQQNIQQNQEIQQQRHQEFQQQ